MVRSGQNRKVNLVNESGLYNLIFRSNKPEARLFRKWVTNEVLPAIRKNGHFSTTPKEDPAHQEVSDLIIKATRIAGIQRILARYLNVSESVLTDIRNRPGKISGKLTSRVAEGCRQIIKTGEVPEGSMRSLNVLELNQMWFDIALIESYEVRKRISQRMKRILGREDVSPIVHSGMYENVTVSQEGGRS